MDKWESLVEQKIREAMQEGAFTDLPGTGQPLDLTENPFEDPTLRMAHRMLKHNGFAPAWIEERKEIDADIAGAQADLARSWRVFQESRLSKRGNAQQQVEADWQHVLNSFRRRVADLNRRIATYNLKAPSTTFHRLPIDAEREINKVANGA